VEVRVQLEHPRAIVSTNRSSSIRSFLPSFIHSFSRSLISFSFSTSIRSYDQQDHTNQMRTTRRMPVSKSQSQSLFLVLFLFFPIRSTVAYSASKSPYIDHRAIAGLWRLTSIFSPSFPMKEFTVYNTRKQKQQIQPPSTVMDEDVLLMLKEDGSFQQYQQENDNDNVNTDVDASWTHFQATSKKRESLRDLVKGIWDYRDGKLILAADRPDTYQYSLPYPQHTDNNNNNNTISARDQQEATSTSNKKVVIQDTLLEGRVVATYEESLQDNPVLALQLPNNDATATNTSAATSTNTSTSTAAATSTTPTRSGLAPSSENVTAAASGSMEATANDSAFSSLDTHLSVPKGSVQVGRFLYPKKHPYFFDQPMFQPRKSGSFSLRQVLGSLNTQNPVEEQEIEKFQRADFYNKTFLLTSHPIGQRQRPRGSLRWSIKYNKFVYDPPSKEAKQLEDEEKARPVQIRVMQVQFHANNTFSSVAGLGESILRGKFDIIGQDKDQLWMQVIRFGFGRSVSGSVYSEGRMLTHEDDKTYWGPIGFAEQGDLKKKKENKEAPESSLVGESASIDMSEKVNDKPGRLEVKGSVMIGWGLEPLPVALFIMREVTELDVLDYDEDDDDDDDDDDEEEEDDDDESDSEVDDDDDIQEGIDWSDSFQ
jgi:hypothetical protein